MRQGYRNPDANFEIASDVEQFNFKLSDTRLLADIKWTISEKLAPVERTNFYLKDERVLINIFIVNSSLLYYFERDWYYKIIHDIRESPHSPQVHLFDRFNFSISDIVLIRADNNPQPAKFDIAYKLALFKYNRLDSRKSIEKNIFIKQDSWTALPESSGDDLYRIKY